LTSGNFPVSLKWEEVPLATPTVETKMGSISKNDYGVHKNAPRSSCRPKRPPITRNEDFFMGNMHIKNSVVGYSVSSDNYVRCRQTCVCDQNICDLNTCEVHKTELIIDKEDKCTGRTMNNNIHKDHDQSNETPTLNKQTKNTFTAFHQHVCGVLNKKEELLNSVTRNSPQIICITEHHLIDEELESITLHSYYLGAKFCT
jgi:hypothetical protein